MKTKMVYQTNQLGLYVGQAEAEESPLEPGVFLIPGGCVETAPPKIPANKAACWINGKWSLVDYFDGLIVYSITTGEPQTITGLGPIPSGYTVKKPGPDQVWKDGEWVDDIGAILAALYEQKLQEINTGCNRHIESGFISSALGGPYRYSSQMDDQINLTGMVLSGLDASYACFDANQVKGFLPHTAAQLHRVSQDLVRFKQAALQHANNLKQDLAIALKDKKLKVMKAIKWAPPA
ncbi:hypothetical protein SAMN03159398_03049 [Pseudomonas sp. NFPP02]|uniref:DUF4376 domain-containing protein n=1 Tax=Pseudomonas sp. NFPP02 TaxID=1566216 RepID=UPI000913CA3B|nr:hypothetical protein [Pseudomonas sp. NFPP02]SFX83869.1 hypothetical protein SAMN03159398_03049 [Pseudomonas sp. NFPP02]